MTKKQQGELLQALWCAINLAHTNEEHIKIMNLLEKYGGSFRGKWQQYMKAKGKSTLEIVLKDIKKILSSLA